MRSKVREDLRKSIVVSTGWLFADLLLALAMLFLAVNTISLPEQKAISKPQLKPTPTAVPPQRLEQEYHRFFITIDRDKLLRDDTDEKKNVMNKVRQQTFLRGRSAGLVIAYGGAPNVADIPDAQKIAGNVYRTLIDSGKTDATFARVSKYDSLYLLGGELSKVEIDIFLFAS